MSAKLVAPGFLKIELLSKIIHDVISFVHDVTNKVLSVDSNYIVTLAFL